MSVQQYGDTLWNLTKYLKKKPNGDFIRMLRTILNKSQEQHPENASGKVTYLPLPKLSKLD